MCRGPISVITTAPHVPTRSHAAAAIPAAVAARLTRSSAHAPRRTFSLAGFSMTAEYRQMALWGATKPLARR